MREGTAADLPQNSELVAGSLTRLDRLLSDYRVGTIAINELIATLAEELAGDSESIESIIICARHQRRICDDSACPASTLD